MPTDVESALLSEDGPRYREAFDWAKSDWPMDEVHPHEAWRFVSTARTIWLEVQ